MERAPGRAAARQAGVLFGASGVLTILNNYAPVAPTWTRFVQDITARKRVEEELKRLALRDDLTGLANRRAFVTVGQQLLRIAERAGETALLAYIDLDNMKAINDRYGHAAGDLALMEMAGLLRRTFRESDVISRLGGDEFCILLAQHAGEARASNANGTPALTNGG